MNRYVFRRGIGRARSQELLSENPPFIEGTRLVTLKVAGEYHAFDVMGRTSHADPVNPGKQIVTLWVDFQGREKFTPEQREDLEEKLRGDPNWAVSSDV